MPHTAGDALCPVNSIGGPTSTSGYRFQRVTAFAELRVEKNPAEFILVDSGPGRHSLELRWEPPLENRVGRVLTLLSLPLLLWLLAARRSSSR